LTCDIANVSTLVFHNDIGTSGHWWLMDDFTYNGTTTPEPGTLVMLGSGLLAAAGMIRRRLS
jgi:PEP-CTERM motif